MYVGHTVTRYHLSPVLADIFAQRLCKTIATAGEAAGTVDV